MQESDRLELERLKSEQALLQSRIFQLSNEIAKLERTLTQQTGEMPTLEISPQDLPPLPMPYLEPTPPMGAPQETKTSPTPTPPPLPPGFAPGMSSTKSPSNSIPAAPEIPPIIPPVVPAQNFTSKAEAQIPEPVPTTASKPILPGSPPPPPDTSAPESLEMHLGIVWLVRIGIVLSLIGFVLFAKNYLGHLGAVGRIILYYCASGALLGFGFWLQRKKEMRNYGQVIFAGGLAAGYFTTYAGYYVPHLQVFKSPILAGSLLVLWSMFMLWISHRKKSELMAFFAIGLAYFASIMNPVGLFTLFSTLLLTLAGLIFLVRNRWAAVSYGTLAATYGTYVFWRYYENHQWLWSTDFHDFEMGVSFLTAYWILFTAATFLARHRDYEGSNRTLFSLGNNLAFFTLAGHSYHHVFPGTFWRFCLVLGSVFLLETWAATRWLRNDRIVQRSLLSQALLLLTLAAMTYFTEVRLSLVLAAESVALMAVGSMTRNPILSTSSLIIAFLATFGAIVQLRHGTRLDAWMAGCIGAFMILNAGWDRHYRKEKSELLFFPVATFYTILGCLVWLVAVMTQVHGENLTLWLGGITVALTLLWPILRIPELVVVGQIFLALACIIFTNAGLLRQELPSDPRPGILIALLLFQTHWWQRQRPLFLAFRQFTQVFFAAGILGILYFWGGTKWTGGTWLIASSGIAVLLSLYGTATRAWYLVAAGQVFLFISAGEMLSQCEQGHPTWYEAAAPELAFAVTIAGTYAWLRRHPNLKGDYARQFPLALLVYRLILTLLVLRWIFEYVEPNQRFVVLSTVGFVLFLWSGWRRNPERLLFSACFSGVGLVTFWFREEAHLHWPDRVGILVILIEQQGARRFPKAIEVPVPVQMATIFIGGFSLWLFVTRWILETGGARYLALGWGLLGFVLFLPGFLLNERAYRWSALAALGAALVRLIILVRDLPSPQREGSFLVIGLALVALGFLYNKFQNRMRQWL